MSVSLIPAAFDRLAWPTYFDGQKFNFGYKKLRQIFLKNFISNYWR